MLFIVLFDLPLTIVNIAAASLMLLNVTLVAVPIYVGVILLQITIVPPTAPLLPIGDVAVKHIEVNVLLPAMVLAGVNLLLVPVMMSKPVPIIVMLQGVERQ